MKTIKSRVDVLNTPPPAGVITPYVDVRLEKETYTEDGRILQRMVQKTVCNSDLMDKFKVSDFCTENLLAIGATDHFKPMSSLPTSDIDTALAAMDKLSQLPSSVPSDAPASPSSSVSEPSKPE